MNRKLLEDLKAYLEDEFVYGTTTHLISRIEQELAREPDGLALVFRVVCEVKPPEALANVEIFKQEI